MNSSPLNSIQINGSTIRVIVGLAVVSVLSLAGDAVVSSRVDTRAADSQITLAATSDAGAIRLGTPSQSSISAVSSGVIWTRQRPATAIAQTGLTGSVITPTVYRFGESQVSLDIASAVTPHYLLAPTAVEDTAVSILVESANGYPTKRLSPLPATISLSGLAYSPRIVVAKPVETLVSLDGYAIPASHIGYGEPLNFGITAGASLDRFAFAAAEPTSFALSVGDASSYNTSELFAEGEMPLLSAHVNVKINNVHYIEQSVELIPLATAVEPTVRRQQEYAMPINFSVAVEAATDSVVRRLGICRTPTISLYGPAVDPERQAGASVTELPLFELYGYAAADVRKESASNVQFALDTVITNATRYRPALPSVCALGVNIQATPTVIKFAEATSCLTLDTNAEGLRYAQSSGENTLFSVTSGAWHSLNYIADLNANATMVTLGGYADASVHFTAKPTYLFTTGYGYITRFRLVEAAAVLDIAAEADAIANPYVKAPEDRTMVVESFGFKEYLHAMSVPAEIRSMVA